MNKIIFNVDALKTITTTGLNFINRSPLQFSLLQAAIAVPIFMVVALTHHSADLSISVHTEIAEHQTIQYEVLESTIPESELMQPAVAKKRKVVARPAVARTSTQPFGGFGSLSAAFAAIRKCESSGNYRAINAAGYYGAYQFHPGTWNGTAQRAGRGDLVGVRPDRAAPADQDAMALALYQRSGWAPWGCARKVGLR